MKLEEDEFLELFFETIKDLPFYVRFVFAFLILFFPKKLYKRLKSELKEKD